MHTLFNILIPVSLAAVVVVLATMGGGLLAQVPQAARAGWLLLVELRIVSFGVIATVGRQALGA